MFLLIGRFSFPCTSFTSYDLHNKEVRLVQYGFFVLSHAAVEGLLHCTLRTPQSIFRHLPGKQLKWFPLEIILSLHILSIFPWTDWDSFHAELWNQMHKTGFAAKMFSSWSLSKSEFLILPWTWPRQDYWGSMYKLKKKVRFTVNLVMRTQHFSKVLFQSHGAVNWQF